MPEENRAGGCLVSPGTVGAVVLAAGAGSRMGHRPKCLLELNGVPLIQRLLMALSVAGIDEHVLVLGHHAERIEPAVRDFTVNVVRNAVPDAGQVSSLRLGLRALSSKVDTVLIALTDLPLLDAPDIVDLLDAYRMRPEGTLVVQPHVEGLPGNPVVFCSKVREEILGSNAVVGCKQWQVDNPCKVHRWTSNNPHYRVDVDSPQDLESLAVLTGLRLRWPIDLQDPM
ncbi:MAG: nucleotidyltransferase family protein [Hydrogenophaga sp.]|nr:nucleotidyltransferase family protein [Hydrogenophaga sp.]MDP3324524.1 nucleotidyltransferase family protein [Hydrogenophaga sp.]